MKPLAKQRWEICKVCPELIPGPFPLMERCGKCHCIMRAKVQISRARCPIGKWDEQEKHDVDE
jgi:hypothetical protein